MNRILRITLLILLFINNVSILVYSQDKKEDDAIYFYRMGNVYYQQARYREAQEMYQKALDLLKDRVAVEGAKKEVKAPAISPAQKEIPQTAKAATEYIIGEDDVLQISVWQNPDLNQETIVRPDGKISFPLIGDVQATGLTITALDEDITNRLKDFIRYPEVSISIKKIGGSRVVVLGQIATPGVYSVSGKKTVMEAVGMAGGFTRDAVPSSTVLIRGGLGTPTVQRINLSLVLKGDLRQNIVLQSQDIVFVPRKFISDLNYFLGQIIDPIAKGAYTNRELQSW